MNVMRSVSSLVQEQEHRYMQRILHENVKQALWPWEPGAVTLYRTEYLSHQPSFIIKVELLPELIFRYEMKQFWDPMGLIYDISDKAFYFYRERPCLPIDDHIVLGEN